ncbi:MAG TPA: TIGR03013 family XrtA/PEP-CTERM system glycosyltransferase [Rhizomicrobium sp.]|nr:TIGR03013 family XrtA/PEP-CTERM system glycosyltransferase [Rhizomicrobium sp.]
MRQVLGHYVAKSFVFLRLIETLLLAMGCSVVLFYSFSGKEPTAATLAAFAGILSLGIIALMHFGGLYRPDIKRTLWRSILITLPIFALAVWTTGELARHTSVPIYPYRWQWTGALTGGWLLSAVLVRMMFQQFHRSGHLTRRVVLVGMDAHARRLDDLARSTHERFRIVGQFGGNSTNGEAGSPTALASFASSLRASEVVVAIGKEVPPWGELAHCRVAGIRITDYLDFFERESRRLCVDNLREDWIALSRGFEGSNSREWRRRSFDVLLALAGFVATAPVLLIVMLGIKLEDGGPVFYAQERIGFGGKPFVLYKLRSMRVDAERDGKPSWAAERDTRITGVGRIIRKLRIDELPQLWNVLRGDMSFIGPRPERPYFVNQFSQAIPFYDYRHVIRPGITGWAQVSFRYGASLEDTRQKLSYDLYYIKNRGVFLDCLILLKTFGVILRGEGAR